MRARWLGVLALAGVAASGVVAQEREDRTLLTQEQMTAIINEASGERAMRGVGACAARRKLMTPHRTS